MFDDYKDSQFLVYSLLMNSIKCNKVSHAYLIDGNNYCDIDNFVMSFIKLLICPYGYSNYDKCKDCNICSRIDNNNYTELRIIKPDGATIKKEQLKDLQNDFSMSNLEKGRMVYVIWKPECMSNSAANSLLKFLEEPNENIVAILVTSNINSVLSTIVSRCQIIKLANLDNFSESTIDNVKKIFLDCDLSSEKFDCLELLSVCINFVEYFENNGVDTLIVLKDIWLDKINDRSCFSFCFMLIIYFYYDILKYVISNDVSFYFDYLDDIVNFSNKLSFCDIINRIKIYIKYFQLLNYNLNLELLMDRMIIELGDVL